MKVELKERTLREAEYIIEMRATVRDAARVFGVSKSTLHQDIQKRLPKLDEKLYLKASEILSGNFSVKHLRGGEATRQKYAKSTL